MNVYGKYIEVVFTITHRRPNPNTAHSGSLTEGLSLPSFKYRSGWNSWGSLKALRSFKIDLIKMKNPVQKIGLTNWSY